MQFIDFGCSDLTYDLFQIQLVVAADALDDRTCGPQGFNARLRRFPTDKNRRGLTLQDVEGHRRQCLTVSHKFDRTRQFFFAYAHLRIVRKNRTNAGENPLPRRRASSLVIQRLAPLNNAVRPSSVTAVLRRTQGLPVFMRVKKPILDS